MRFISASRSRSIDLVERGCAARDQSGAEQQPGDAQEPERVAVGHRVADQRGRDDQQVQPRLRQRDEIARPRRATRSAPPRRSSRTRLAVNPRTLKSGTPNRRTGAAEP